MKGPITQRHEMGCGAVCVAFVCDATYDEIVAKLGVQSASIREFRLKELREVIDLYGLSYRQSLVNRSPRSRAYKDRTIVFIKRSKRYPYGHYLVRYNNAWMDPWINLPNDNNLSRARSGYRKRLPGKAQWIIFPEMTNLALIDGDTIKV